jgi:polysaccharide export outer membrane protein
VPAPQSNRQDSSVANFACGTAGDDSIAASMRRAGLSPEELRNRLRAGGYDINIATPWLGSLSDREAQGIAPPTPAQRTAFAAALCNLGILEPPDQADSQALGVQVNRTAFRTSRGEDRSRIFGKALFGQTTNLFDPITSGPVDPSYRIGAGDRLQLVLTGDVEAAYQLEIRGDGTIVLPQIGQIAVGGLTLDGARTVLRRRAASAYSSVGSGQTNVDLTVARLRSNVVFITGEVEYAGAYQVSSLGTVFHALTKAGGPTERGSFRSIELRRAGTVIKKLDLYDYLLRGDASSDERTEQGDIIFVPLNVRSVEVRGAVRRPAIFELKPEEGFRDLLRFAGGLEPTAAVDRVQIDRILAPRDRQPGRERAIIDIKTGGNVDSLSSTALNDGDVITVFSIGHLRRNSVFISGAVFQPGVYQLTPNMTLDSLVRGAHGLTQWAIADRLKLSRSIPETGRSEFLSLDYRTPKDRGLALQEYDSVVVLDGRDAFPAGAITVSGAVNRVGTMPFAEGQTLQDVIDLSRGFRENAASVEVARVRRDRSYSDTTSIVTLFQIDDQGKLEPRAAAFGLARDDRVFVRPAPGFRPQRFVEITGLVKYPGTYAIGASQDHLLDLVDRAGGLLPTAYPDNFVFLRDGRPVAIALSAALKGDRDQNIALEGGDKIVIGPNSNTVFVTGSVEHPSLVLFRPGRSLREYIDLAGGPSANADMGRARVTYASGSSVPVRRYFLLPDRSPSVLAGSTITVPAKPAARDGQVTQNITTIAQVASTLASLAFAYIALVKR